MFWELFSELIFDMAQGTIVTSFCDNVRWLYRLHTMVWMCQKSTFRTASQTLQEDPAGWDNTRPQNHAIHNSFIILTSCGSKNQHFSLVLVRYLWQEDRRIPKPYTTQQGGKKKLFDQPNYQLTRWTTKRRLTSGIWCKAHEQQRN
jgi:hypothetical protein